MKEVFLFQSPNNGRFCSGVFSNKETAEIWIKKYSLTGALTVYPIDESAYDWALRTNAFKPKNERELSSEFIAGFSSSSQLHFHYEDGVLQ